jgi:separase
MAACELLRPPELVSLRQLIGSIHIDGTSNLEEERLCVVGAIIERQVESLGGSLWKSNVQNVVAGLLSDCVSTYDTENRPIRRASVMLRALAVAYYTGAADRDVQLAKSSKEIETLLRTEVPIYSSPSSGLLSYGHGYRITV